MIRVVFDREAFRVTVEGHACSGEAGKDLVCAGASALVYTLAANAGDFVRRGMVRRARAELKSGKAEIQCVPGKKFAPQVLGALEAVCLGFGLLGEQFPQYLQYTEVGAVKAES